MPPDFTSTWAKLGRAEEHFKSVHKEIVDWIQASQRTFSVEKNSDLTRTALIAKFPGPAGDFRRWTLIIGDCIVNLRSALDHLVYAIAKWETRNDPAANVESLAFIICDEEPEFIDRQKKRLKHLSVPVVAAIKEVQPFLRNPYPEIRPMLAILRDFSNSDKHRFLRLANSAMTKWELYFAGPTTIQRQMFLNPEEIENDSIFCVIESSEPDPNLEVPGGAVQLVVALWHGLRPGDTNPMNDRSDFSSLLDGLIKEVRFVIEKVSAAVA